MSQFQYAFSLSKEQLAEAKPPGTVRLIEKIETSDHITLQPPPTLSPADLFNWAKWRKYTILAIMRIYCSSVNFASALIAPASPILVPLLPRPANTPPVGFEKLTHLIA